MQFSFKRLEIPDVILVEPRAFPDGRGYFFEGFRRSAFKENGIDADFVQDNMSHSVRGVIRGMHYQMPPHQQAKLITAITGRIFDVAVDLRRDSPTYGRWVGEILSQENHRSLYVPEGFAHGFCVMSDQADVMYKVGSEYAPESERGIVWNDPELNIRWPVADPTVSERDARLPSLRDSDGGF